MPLGAGGISCTAAEAAEGTKAAAVIPGKDESLDEVICGAGTKVSEISRAM